MKITNQAPPPVREVAIKSIYTLKTQQNKLEQASFRLKERDRILFETCMSALKKNNKEKANMCATEIAEVRKLVKFLYNVQLAIERVILRLETIKELGDIVADLKPALRLLQNVSQDLFQVLPDVSTELTNVNSAIQDTLQQTKLTTDENLVPVGRKTEAGEEILKEVSNFIEQSLSETLPEPPAITTNTPLKEKIPQPPIREMVALTASSSQVFGQKTLEQSGFDPEKTLFSYKKSEIKEFSVKVEKTSLDIEEILLEYVRKANGEIDLSRCSSELQTSNEEIEKALENLGSKGKIKLELRSPE
ncbi:Snf7 family protein [Candidatus Bathycorpusculum sp.]|jgi:division protein CdvB (Snf7/Vps24/ESCRT-III family)|uniref:Snf7 family protein n=1 Tax=Candidatus Bathycorpusculum sp. TaxID=2994959 RepID=UPI002837089E|nr:Snf7 family protein [Candidatus Termitimicrobium sp.]MCL2432399.1 Snf7 family protein [Candidatus Termitimicrobium sp.]